jgi:hypothetical protein
MRRGAVSVIVLLTVLLASTPALAGEEKGTDTLEFLEYVDVMIDNTDGKTMRVHYSVEVTAGVNVNVYFMDKEGYDDYKDPLVMNLSYYPGHSVLDTKGAERTFTWSEEGEFYLVIDNTGFSSMDTATVDYDVTWSSGGFLGFPWWCWVVLIIVIISLLGLGFLFRRGRPGTPTTPGEGPAELSPQPEPPDAEVRAGMTGEVAPHGEGMTELSPQPEPPDLEVQGEGQTELSPQPEPPDGEVRTDVVMPPTEGQTELGPQPEPPDSETPTDRPRDPPAR